MAERVAALHICSSKITSQNSCGRRFEVFLIMDVILAFYAGYSRFVPQDCNPFN